jgi:hypothetical protein
MLTFKVEGPRKAPRIRLWDSTLGTLVIPPKFVVDYTVEIKNDVQEVWMMGQDAPDFVKTGLMSAVLVLTLLSVDMDDVLRKTLDVFVRRHARSYRQEASAMASERVRVEFVGQYDDGAFDTPAIGIAQNDAQPGETVRVSLAEVFAREYGDYVRPVFPATPKPPVTTFGGARPPLADTDDL